MAFEAIFNDVMKFTLSDDAKHLEGYRSYPALPFHSLLLPLPTHVAAWRALALEGLAGTSRRPPTIADPCADGTR